MMKRRLATATLCAAAVAGCSTVQMLDPGHQDRVVASLDSAAGSLVGTTESALLDRFGRPDDRYDFADGGRELTWRARQNQFWCELKARVDGGGRTVAADWHNSGDIGGLELCERWLL